MKKQRKIAERNSEFLEVVSLIKESQWRAIQSVNRELIDLYWSVGQYIHDHVKQSNWGQAVVKELAAYLQDKEPGLKGFSDKNLWRMKQFFETYKDNPKLSALLRELTWTNNLIILSRTRTMEEKTFYIHQSVQERYSSRELDRQINSCVYERTILGKKKKSKTNNIIHENIARTFKDSYIFEFLGLPENFVEKDLKKQLIRQMKNFVLELGKDFLFVGEEYRIQVGQSDFYIDLLFYHRSLQCLVVLELKTERFKAEHLGQLNFYLEALDRDVKKKGENPSMGILLCKDKDNEVVKYALNRMMSPTLVAEYKTQLPNKKFLQSKMQEMLLEEDDC